MGQTALHFLCMKKIIKDMTVEEKKPRLKKSDFLSTGSTLLNLACSGKHFGGFVKGKYFFLVGDSISGKTFLSLTCLAEAAINPSFANYRFIYDNGEDGALMDLAKFFGKAVAERLEPPAMKDGMPVYSTTIEEFYYHLDDAVKGSRPVIYIQDSMDVLSSDSEEDKFQKVRAASRKGTPTTGSYGDGKAKKNSAGLRRIIGPLRESGSILIVLCQTRDSITSMFPTKTRSGGHALRFYATLELWSSVKAPIVRTVRGKKRNIGNECVIRCKKNRLTGKDRTVTLPIYYSFGFDDVGGCVRYLCDEGGWDKNTKTGMIDATDFGIKGGEEKIVAYIESNDLEPELKLLVIQTWNEIEKACTVKRKIKYE